MKKLITSSVLALIASLNVACAHPHYYSSAPVYSQPPVYYTPPPPVYYTPPPVYVAPPPPVYCYPPVYRTPSYRYTYSGPTIYGPSIGLGFSFNKGRSFIGVNF